MTIRRFAGFLATTAALGIACGGVPDPTEAQASNVDAVVPDSFTKCAGTSLAHETFNAFWTELDQKYALFPQRLASRSWAQIGADGCAKLKSDIEPAALYDLLLGMAENLEDAHTALTADELDRDSSSWGKGRFRYYAEVESLRAIVSSQYLDDTMKLAADDEIAWGKIGTIGYVSITSMDAITADTDDEDPDRAASNPVLKRVMTDLRDSTGLIIDVRANTGGYDSVSLDIARWIAGPRALAWSKQIRNGPKHTDLSEPVPTYLEASVPGAYAGPVVLLTSRGSLSAAETFTVAMSTRPSVAIMGEPGSGHFSDMWDVELPNGWTLDFSGELYTAPDGEVYETKGFPVDVSVPFDEAARDQLKTNKKDVMLEAALAHLR